MKIGKRAGEKSKMVCEVWTLTSVESAGKGWTITSARGLSTFMPRNPSVRAPLIGDEVRVYGGLGLPVRGMDLNVYGEWKQVWFNTEAEMALKHRRWVQSYDNGRRSAFERGGKEKLDRLYDELPLPLKRRLDRFRREDPDFRWASESYEMAACAEAGRLLRRAKDPEFGKLLKKHKVRAPSVELLLSKKPSHEWKFEDGIEDWADNPMMRLLAFDALNSQLNGYKYDLMKEIMPEMNRDHSGNTWAFAIGFAKELIRNGDKAKL